MATVSVNGKFLTGATNETSFTSLTSIGEVISITGPNIAPSSVKTTHLASTNAADEFTPGFADPGTVSTRLNMIKADLNTIYGFYRTLKGCMVMFGDGASTSTGSRWTFNAFWTELGNEVPENDRVTTDVTWKISGKPGFTTGT